MRFQLASVLVVFSELLLYQSSLSYAQDNSTSPSKMMVSLVISTRHIHASVKYSCTDAIQLELMDLCDV